MHLPTSAVVHGHFFVLEIAANCHMNVRSAVSQMISLQRGNAGEVAVVRWSGLIYIVCILKLF